MESIGFSYLALFYIPPTGQDTHPESKERLSYYNIIYFVFDHRSLFLRVQERAMRLGVVVVGGGVYS